MSARDAVEAAFTRIRARNAKFNCFTELTEARAYREADDIDERRVRGEKLGPLAGVPYAVKNLYDVEGLVTLAGSKINRENPPAKRDAFVVRRLREAGAVLVGTCNMDEYAYGFTTENFHYGPARNPHDPSRTAGGSSGGSAAAVAADMMPIALGSDTNGSIRVPAGLCGIFGVKPTYGRLSRQGVFPFVPSLDHTGSFARNVDDLAACYDAMQGHDPEDAACRERPAEPVSPSVGLGIDRIRVAVATGNNYDEFLFPEALAAVKRAADCLNAKRKIDVPEFARARAAAQIITSAEAANLQMSNIRKRPGDYDPATRDRFLAGALIPAEWVLFAQRFRAWYRQAWRGIFARADVVVAAATAFPAQQLGQDTIALNGRAVPLRPAYGLLTAPFSFIGVPVVTVPMRHSGPLPVGVQLIAPPWREDLAFRVAAYLEREGATAKLPHSFDLT